MNLLSGEEWKKEQDKDNCRQEPRSLDVIEKSFYVQKLSEVQGNEHERFNYNPPKDIEVCSVIDSVIVPAYGRDPIYGLSLTEMQLALRFLQNEYQIPERQVKICLYMLSDFFRGTTHRVCTSESINQQKFRINVF